MRDRKRIGFIVAAALLATALVAGWWTRGYGLLPSRDSASLALYGNVDIREVNLAFERSGLIDRIAVEEGEAVKVGQFLAKLSTRDADDRIAETRASVNEARANLAELSSGSRPQEIGRASASVKAATATYDTALLDYRRREPLSRSGAISGDVWNQTVAGLRRAEAQLEDARQSLSLAKSGARSQQIDAARARLGAARARAQSAAGDLSDTSLLSPVLGTVVTRVLEPGAYVQPGTTVLTIAIARPLRVRAYVAESDLPKVRPGMRVSIEVDGAGRRYRGRIGYISPQAEFTPRTVETESLRTDLVYRLRIIVDDPDAALRQGQPVTVIVTAASPSPGER